MNDKQRSYIATAIAGTRQQNYFLALMNDMSKGIEGGSRAFELYDKAMSASGTTATSYETYMDSVTAAQDRMKASLESLYALFSSDIMKGFYDIVSGIVDTIVAGTKATDSLNLKLVAITATLGIIASIVGKTMTAFATGGMALGTVSIIQLVTTAIGGLAAVMTTLGGAAETSAKKLKKLEYDHMIDYLGKSTSGAKALIAQYKTLSSHYDTLNPNTQEAADTLQEMSNVITKLKTEYPEYGHAIENAGVSQAAMAEQVKVAND